MNGLRLILRFAPVCLAVFAFASFSAVAQSTAPNEWTWVGGSSTTNSPNGQPGQYGTVGIAAAANTPGGRDGGSTWTDKAGDFWLFGGEGADANGNFGQLNDLWQFQPSTQQWAWMGGSSTVPSSCAGSTTVACGQRGTYGTRGVTAASNLPGGRSAAAYWTDNNGKFWIFGGYGFDMNGTQGYLNDLWQFDPSTKEWTWVGGSSTVGSQGGQSGVYGTLTVAAAQNIPGGRYSATFWTDTNGQLWLYGGLGFDSMGDNSHLDDLWKFDPETEQWTWMSGDSTAPSVCETGGANTSLCGWPATYGPIRSFAPGIGPGSRIAGTSWTGSGNNLWLFGGEGTMFWESRDFSPVDQYDLWELNTSTTQWAWMSGNTTSICGESSSEESWCGQNGFYGTEGIPAIGNIPPSRESAVSWSDSSGNLWLFGGAQPSTTSGYGASLCNDVWVYEPSANEWAWMNGTGVPQIYACSSTSGSYGKLGLPAPANSPSGRVDAARWTDSSGNLWMFGGYGWQGGNIVDLNDLWVYKSVAPAPRPSFAIIATPNPINIQAMGTGAPTITTGTTSVQVMAADGFNSPVTLTATPATMNGVTDITGSFSPATITGSGTSTLTISVTGAAVLIASEYPLTITATSGGISQSIDVIVDVTTGGLRAPTFSPAPGAYSTPQTVTITGSNYIYYTTDGTTPSASSAVYVNPLTVGSTTTLKAISMDVFDEQSALATATYTITSATATPVFSPSGGTFSSAQQVMITDSTPSATLYYTTDGSNPSTSSATYTGAVTVSSSETVKAIAVATGYAQSSLASATFTILQPGFSITGTNISVIRGATTGNTSTNTLTPSNGFTGAVSLSCAITPAAANDPATCSIPASVTISGTTPVTTTLTVQTTPASSGALRFLLPSTGSATLACLLLFGIPNRRRRWTRNSGLALLLLSIVGCALGCGGGTSGTGGTGSGSSGTSPGSYTVTVTGTSGSITQKATVSLVVQ